MATSDNCIVMEPIKSSKVDISVQLQPMDEGSSWSVLRRKRRTKSQAPLAMGPGGLVVTNLGVLKYNDTSNTPTVEKISSHNITKISTK